MEDKEYFAWLEGLKYLTNKKDFEKTNGFKIRHGLILIIDHIEKDKLPYTIDEHGFYMWVKFSTGKIRTFYERNYGINDYMLIKTYNDKVITGKILEQNNIPTPATFLLHHQISKYLKPGENDIFGAKKFCEKIGFPIIAKPKGASLGRGVEKLFSQEDLQDFFDRFLAQDEKKTYILQPYVKGKDIRVVFFDGKIHLAYERIAMSIEGDGKSSIQELVKDYISQNQNEKFELDEKAIFSFIKKEGHKLDQVLELGETIPLVPTSNVSSGGNVKNYIWNDQEEKFVKKVVDIFGAPLTGLDILTTSTLDQGSVLELNHTPMFDGASRVEENFDKKITGKMWDYIKRQENFSK